MFGIDDALIGAVAGPLIGGAIGSLGQSSANATNMSIAQKQMDFQERMSDTMYQRGTKDMIAAGLNPILAAGNIATSSPGGAGLPVQNPLTGIGDAVSGSVNSAMALLMQKAQMDKVRQDTQKAAADTEGSRLQNWINGFGQWMDNVSRVNDLDTDPKSPYNANVTQGGKTFVPYAVQLLQKQAGMLSSAAELNKVNADLGKADMDRRTVEGSKASGYLNMFLKGIGGASGLFRAVRGIPNFNFGSGGPSIPDYVGNIP